MRAKPRREQILKLLEKTGMVSVGQMANRFALSVVTIRKDLADLASEGLLQRAFGGAVFFDRSLFNSSFGKVPANTANRSRQLPARPLEYIQDGDTVILDAGTTTLALALALLGREALTILGRYRANKAFLGSSGFTAKRGHCKPNPADAQIKESIIGTKLFKIWSQLLI